MFCQSHHWLLAAGIFFGGSLHTMDIVASYCFWLGHQLELQQTALAHAQADTFAQDEQQCVACSLATEATGEAVRSIVRWLQEPSKNTPAQEGTLLCLFHWRQVHNACAAEPEAIILQKKLLAQQQHLLAQLDLAVEAYIARFNAAKRERGEVPDIPGAALAWERLLAFFVGEPALAYTLES